MATQRRGRRQLQFTGFEMAMIGASFVVTVTSVFFLGLFVGKKNASVHAAREDRTARIPVDDFAKYVHPAVATEPMAPVAASAPALAPGVHKAVAALPAAEPANRGAGVDAKAKAPSKADAVVGPALAPTGKTPDMVAMAEPPSVVVTPSLETAEQDAAKAATKDHAKDAAKEAADKAAKDAAAAKTKAEAKAAADAKAAAEAAKAAEAKKQEEAATGRGYTVQVLATRKQADAEALLRKLKARGYGAYIKRVSDGENSWFRVRVGSYGGFGDARSMADRCRHDLGLEAAFVSTE